MALNDSTTLNDPIEERHPQVAAAEPTDWRDRGSVSEVVGKLWHGRFHDFGALTRFGMGWGPIEVVRAARNHDADGITTRILHIRLNGKRVYTILVTGDDATGSTVVCNDEELGDTFAFSGDRFRALQAERDELAATVQEAETEIDRETDAMENRLARLLKISTRIQEDLTEMHRRKRYVTRESMLALDELHRALGGTVNVNKQ